MVTTSLMTFSLFVFIGVFYSGHKIHGILSNENLPKNTMSKIYGYLLGSSGIALLLYGYVVYLYLKH